MNKFFENAELEEGLFLLESLSRLGIIHGGEMVPVVLQSLFELSCPQFLLFCHVSAITFFIVPGVRLETSQLLLKIGTGVLSWLCEAYPQSVSQALILIEHRKSVMLKETLFYFLRQLPFFFWRPSIEELALLKTWLISAPVIELFF